MSKPQQIASKPMSSSLPRPGLFFLSAVTGICAALLLMFTLPQSLGAQASPPPFGPWQTQKNADNPLVGKIFDTRKGEEISPRELIERLVGEKFILLGEIHDNPDHHRAQAWVISELTALHRRPSIVMEQIRADQAGVLKLFMSGKHKTAERMGPAIGWERSGWPKWSLYQPIAKAALAAGLPIYAGDTSKDMNRKVGKQGFKALPPEEVESLGLRHPLGRRLDKALASDLVASHCDMMPASMMGPMALVQRYRDAHLARAMREADKGDGALLITGNGHARTDRAVPWYLRGAHTSSKTLMMVEASSDAQNFLDLIPLDPDKKPTADYIWVTPAAARTDPCEKLRKQFGPR